MRAAACLGSRYRGDDAVGPLVADRLRAAGATVLECDDEPTRLLDAWAGLDLVVIVDAVSSGAAAGTVHRVDPGDGPLPGDLGPRLDARVLGLRTRSSSGERSDGRRAA